VTDLGRNIALIGGLLLVVGLAMMLFGRLGAPRLPGDIVVRRGGFTVYFPIVTSILLSLILTVVLNLVFRRR
jgi:hypothetical protein